MIGNCKKKLCKLFQQANEPNGQWPVRDPAWSHVYGQPVKASATIQLIDNWSENKMPCVGLIIMSPQ